MADHDLSEELEAVRSDIGKLRSDMGGVAEALRDVTRTRAEEAREGLASMASSVRDEIRRNVENVRERGRGVVDEVETRIEQRPLTSLLIAFGAGLLLGKLLDRS